MKSGKYREIDFIEILEKLLKNEDLTLYNDHQLKGEFSKYRELHIKPDWLLIYSINNDELILTLIQTGSHSDLFE